MIDLPSRRPDSASSHRERLAVLANKLTDAVRLILSTRRLRGEIGWAVAHRPTLRTPATMHSLVNLANTITRLPGLLLWINWPMPGRIVNIAGEGRQRAVIREMSAWSAAGRFEIKAEAPAAKATSIDKGVRTCQIATSACPIASSSGPRLLSPAPLLRPCRRSR
jgi:hypothetical protein